MMSRRISLGLALAAVAALSGCGGPVYRYRYRLTIEVDTPEGMKSGSGVTETEVQDDRNAWWEFFRMVHTRTVGEAVFVDLGEGKNLIALMAMGPDGRADPDFASLPSKVFNPRSLEERANWQQRKGQFTVPLESVPTLVTFSNRHDPRTVRIVRPGEVEAVLGPGVRFRRAFIEMTNDPIARNIRSKLPWLATLNGTLGGERTVDWSRPEKQFTTAEFVKGAF